MTFDPDPAPAHNPERVVGPVHQVANGVWLVTRLAEARQVLTAPQMSKRSHRAGSSHLPAETMRLLGHHMLNTDPPDHTRLRHLVGTGFTAQRTRRLRPRVRQIADELLDRMAATGRTDLLTAYAFPLPLRVLCEFVGLPTGDGDRFLAWTRTLLRGTAPASVVLDVTRAMHGYIQDLVESKREDPRDDLLSDLVRARHEGEHLTDAELVSTVFMLITAGFDTTAGLIGNGAHLLLTRHADLERLRDDPECVPGAVEEFLRYRGPVETARTRFTRAPIVLGDTTIPAHQSVLVSLASANRDPDTFAEPDRLDITRPDAVRHLTFGHGTHFCLGAALARLQGVVAFTSLLSRFPALRLAVRPEDLEWRPSALVRGLTRLPVTW